MIDTVIITLLIGVLIGIIHLFLVLSKILKILQSNLSILDLLEKDIDAKETDDWVKLWCYINIHKYLEENEEYEMLKNLYPKIKDLFDKLRS